MAKLKKGHFSGLSNIFGEKGKNLVDILNGKPDHADFDGLTAVTTADATDATTAIALANDLKAKFNALLTALKTPA